MDVFQRKKLNVINFTCEEIPFIEKIPFEKVISSPESEI